MRTTRRRRAFTLIEMLTSMAVLAILVVILAQSIGMVSNAWRAGKARIDNFSQARLALSLLDRDLQSAILRRDLAVFFDKNGDPACAFYTEMRGGEGNRRVSLVRYFLDTTTEPDNPTLKRDDFGLNYESGADARTLTLGVTDELPDLPDLADAALTANTVAEGVLAFNWQFLTNDGSLLTAEEVLAANRVPVEGSDSETQGVYFNFNDPDFDKNIRALVISVVILDGGTTRLAEELEVVDNLLTAFQVVPEPGETYAEAWQDEVDAMQTSSEIPVLVQRSIRVFERTVKLPLNL
ncbi:MAG: prepilin-type N-terminal cleavage/methylation domain-containing protein [Verrucomicrobiota bacterium]